MRSFRTAIMAALACAVTLTLTPVEKAWAGDPHGRPHAAAWGPGWMIRTRTLGVIPDADGDDILLDGVPLASADIDIETSVVPELDISYFFTRRIAMELILAVTPHDIKGKSLLQGHRGENGDLGEAWLLPPTLLAQYHFNPGGKMKPYLGIGVNYTVMFNENGANARLHNAGLTATGLDLDDEWGWAVQAGADFHLYNNIYFNVDVKKLFLETDATVFTAEGPIVTADVDIDPLMLGMGFGIKF